MQRRTGWSRGVVAPSVAVVVVALVCAGCSNLGHVLVFENNCAQLVEVGAEQANADFGSAPAWESIAPGETKAVRRLDGSARHIYVHARLGEDHPVAAYTVPVGPTSSERVTLPVSGGRCPPGSRRTANPSSSGSATPSQSQPPSITAPETLSTR